MLTSLWYHGSVSTTVLVGFEEDIATIVCINSTTYGICVKEGIGMGSSNSHYIVVEGQSSKVISDKYLKYFCVASINY